MFPTHRMRLLSQAHSQAIIIPFHSVMALRRCSPSQLGKVGDIRWEGITQCNFIIGLFFIRFGSKSHPLRS